MLERLKNWRFQRALREGIRNRKLPASGRGLNLETARSVAILFDATEVDERKVVIDFARRLRKRGAKVRPLGFFTSDIGDSSFGFPTFTAKSLNWYGIPKPQPAIDDFLRNENDLLLVIQAKATPLFDYLAALAPAAFKVGPVSDMAPTYDLMLDVPAKADHRFFIRQVEDVLKVTNAQLQLA